MRGSPVPRAWVALAVLCPGTGSANGAHEREGFVLTAGAGAASPRAECRECATADPEVFFALGFRLGDAVTEHLVVAGQFDAWFGANNAWVDDDRDLTPSLGNLSLVALYYPRSASGFFAKAGAGLSTVQFHQRGEGTTSTSLGQPLFLQEPAGRAFGPGIVAGLGYDFRIARMKSLTLELGYAWGRPGTLREDGRDVASDWRQDVFSLTLSYTAH